ncbi:hypothetical protein M3Y95_01240600 [Aphelenchoides besseyi]|nr:hypothetical protein M3Y95_01240600 [Aphelenchoides besseyi]
MSNFDQQLHNRLKFFQYFNFILSTLLLPIIIFMFSARSFKLGKYRYYLLNTNIWHYVVSALIFFINPILFLPSMCVSANPMLPLQHNQFSAIAYLTLFALINLELSTCCSLLYRCSKAFHGLISSLFDRTPWTETCYVVVFLFFQILILGSIFMQQTSGEEQTRIQFAIENPDLIDHFKDKPLMCFANTELSRLIMLYISFILLFFYLAGNVLWARLLYALYSNKNHVRSHNMQVMLFKVLVVRMHVAYILFLIPVYVVCVFIYIQYKHTAYYTTIVVALISSYSWIDYMVLLYFVVPYRETIRKALKLCFCPSQVVAVGILHIDK